MSSTPPPTRSTLRPRMPGIVLLSWLAVTAGAEADVCGPRLVDAAGDPDSRIEIIDGDPGTFWLAPAGEAPITVTVDLGCTASLQRLRRYMSCNGSQTSGPSCPADSTDGFRHQGFDLVRFGTARELLTDAVETVTSGWEEYRFTSVSPGGTSTWFDQLPYGWTPWLDFRSAGYPEGVEARYVQFGFRSHGDALHEIAIEYVAGPPRIVAQADVRVRLIADPAVVSSDSAFFGSYTASITNHGPFAATSLRLALNPNASFSAVPADVTCVGRSGSCSLDHLAAGATATVAYTVSPIDAPELVSVSAREPDPRPANNFAQATVTIIDCDNLSQACPLIGFLGKSICEAQTDLAGRLGRATRRLLRVATQALAVDPEIFYRLREEVLRRTPEGRRYIALYELHGGAIASVLLGEPAVAERALDALERWEPLFGALVDGEGTGTTIPSDAIVALDALLDDLAAFGSPALAAAIATERAALDLPSYGGLSIGDAVARFQQPGCANTDETLCLQDGRFRATVSWRDPSGRTGHGHAAPLSADTGTFWFFTPQRTELVVKALDGRVINSKWWVFAGALSNVEYTLRVTDTVSGEEQLYTNPAGTLASFGDTNAFAAGAPPTPVVADSPPSGDELLELGGRYQFAVSWRDFAGRSGTGRGVQLSSESGYFWFFSPRNVELIVKAVDGRGVNGHRWVFYGALSNVQYTLTVTDTETGVVQIYSNPAGHFASRGDTSAF